MPDLSGMLKKAAKFMEANVEEKVKRMECPISLTFDPSLIGFALLRPCCLILLSGL